ncbi:lipopolysaccharide heptosyltransferase I [Methylovulum sp.]|uniref:lipopolysaccharide heptosyltransferase I n=1 Tax=Methylovulum sp. TaxID=1916980 RepID=UPI00261CDB3A|nr:lipopolysaccharide heptosyltransferase I [Methylovulum sp.]MDD5125142.1 lipopolysaccharide heptosyltransferase I [Methylovulum sp.]
MKIAIVKLSALGDIVHAMVALQFIKAQHPDAQIDWVVEQRFAELLNHQPDIDNVLTVDLRALKADKTGILKEIKRLRRYASKHYDLVIDAQGLLKSSITARLLGKRVSGFDANSIRERAASWFYTVKIAFPYDANTIDRNATVLTQPLGFHISREQILEKKPFLFFRDEDERVQLYLHRNQKNIVLVIGSTWESRNYPIEKFVNIANALQQNCLVVWGNEEEKKKAEWMCDQSEWVQIMPKLDLNDLKALIARADLVIGNDTGPTHMAWGLNRPSITIFGPTPLSRVYQTDINKTVKSASIVNPHKLDKQDYSIRDIDEQEIIDIANILLTSKLEDPLIVNAAKSDKQMFSTWDISDEYLDEITNSLTDIDTEDFFR